MFIRLAVLAQSIVGELPLNANQTIRLIGFNGLETYTIARAKCDSMGSFFLSYTEKDYGVGALSVDEVAPIVLLLNRKDIEVTGLSFSDSMDISSANGNVWLQTYAAEQPKRDRALSAWKYLKNLYRSDSLFLTHPEPLKSIQKEIKRLQEEDLSFMSRLPTNSYVQWYLPLKKLVNSVSIIAEFHAEEIPMSIAAFRKLDYGDSRLYKSGLLKGAIDGHFWLLANSGQSFDAIFGEMKLSIDAMVKNLIHDELILNEVMAYLFDLLERHSYYEASEYLALKVLNETSCVLDSKLSSLLETYRAMKIGNIAPDISFERNFSTPGYIASATPQSLSELDSKYTLIVFGASWCSRCSEDIPELTKCYPYWKNHGLEVIYISLEESNEMQNQALKSSPFIVGSEYEKWNSGIINDYHVIATPTMYLLDSQRKIVLRPTSVRQMNAWVESFLVEASE